MRYTITFYYKYCKDIDETKELEIRDYDTLAEIITLLQKNNYVILKVELK